MRRHTHRSIAWSALGGYGIALLAGVLALTLFQAYHAGFSGADEPAHFLNGYFVSNYLHGHAGANPMAYAAEYYLHYPKISIGHWPPAYYGLLGLLLLVLPATPEAAFIVNLIVASLPAALLGAALAMLAGWRIALAGCAVYALAPLAIEGQAYLMLDQALTACCMAATAAWLAYVRRPGWTRAFLFAALAATAVLIKGNGWLIGLVPLLHIALNRDWRLLARPHLYVAAAAAAAIVVPWYWLTASISADGFHYQAGWSYALRALQANLHTLLRNLGYAGAPLALIAIVAGYRRRLDAPTRWRVVSAGVSLMLATLALQSLVPADIDDRYLAPALPAYVALAALGVAHVHAWLRDRTWRLRHLVPPATTALMLALLVPGLLHIAGRGAKADMRTADIPPVAAQFPPVVWLIDGSSGAEGAVIAHLAVRDPGLRHYAVRASKLLATSDFMGDRYALKYPDARAVTAELRRLGVQYVVLVRLDNSAPFPHSVQLSEAMHLPDAPFRQVLSLPHRNRRGVTEVYAFSGTAGANLDAVRQLGIPAKSSALLHLTHK